MSEGTENQQGQQGTGSQGQADAQSAHSASSGQAGSGQAVQGANAAQSASAGQAGQPAAQTGQSTTGGQQPAQGQQAEGAQTRQTEGGQAQLQTPATQAKGIQVKLSQEQIDRLVKDGTLELSDETFTGAVRDRIAQLTARAKGAERRLAEIAAAQEETERKALEEQERFKELYEKERQAREKETSARKDDAVRTRFLLAAQSKGVVDPDVAFIIARSLPAFGAVQVDDEGKVTGIDEVVESLVKEKPYLVSQPQQQPKPQSVGAASNPAPQSPPSPKNLAEAGDRLEQALRTGVT